MMGAARALVVMSLLTGALAAPGCGNRDLHGGPGNGSVATRGDGEQGGAGVSGPGVGGAADPGSIGGSGWGGDPGATGVGGAGGCAGTPVNLCVTSCAVDVLNLTASGVSQICDQGILRCPDGTIDINTCPVGTCARVRPRCCNPVTGQESTGVCQAEGTRACPAETPAEGTYHRCVPDGLAPTGCTFALEHQPCGAGPERGCWDSGIFCICDVPSGDGGLVWRCQIPIP